MKEEEIKAVLLGMDDELVRDALTLLLAESGTAAPEYPVFTNFAQAIVFLRKNYDFAELEVFSTEADLVYVSVGGRRILLSDMSVPNEKYGRPRQESLPGDAGGKSGGERGEAPWREAAVRESPGRFSRLEF